MVTCSYDEQTNPRDIIQNFGYRSLMFLQYLEFTKGMDGQACLYIELLLHVE